MNPSTSKPPPISWGRWSLKDWLWKSRYRLLVVGVLIALRFVVWFWPRSAFGRHLMQLAAVALAISAFIAGLTYWRRARVQIGRHGMRYKVVRWRAIRVARSSLSFVLIWVLAVEYTRTAETPPAPVREMTVAIARIPGDSNNRLQSDLQRALASLKGIGIQSTKVTQAEAPQGTTPGFFEHENAEDYLRTTESALLLWGKAESNGTAMLYETGLDEWMQFGATFTPHDFKLPELPSLQLASVVKLMVAVQSATFHLGNLTALNATLTPLIAPVRAMADNNSSSYSPDTRARLNYIVARALTLDGNLTWREPLVRSAIAYYLAAIAGWNSAERAPDRAMALNSLGESLQLLSVMQGDNAPLAESIRAYEAAIEVYSPEADPLDRAATQQRMGRMLRSLGATGDARQLAQALSAFQSAMQVFTEERYPEEWASLQADIGMTEAAIGRRVPGTDHLRAAVDSYNQALTVRTRDQMPYEWAFTQSALAQTLTTLGERDPSSGGDEQAVAADRSALEVLTPETDPDDWATAEINLGVALSSIAQTKGQADQMQEAVDQLREGATDRLRERDPNAWVEAQAALASTLEELGQLEAHQVREDESHAYQLDRESEEHMEEAVAAARAGLTMVTEQGSPNMWGYLQDQQAEALEEIGYREASNHDDMAAAEHLREAVAADHAALRTLTMTNAPDNWADAERNLGDALVGLNDFEPNSSDLQEGVTAYRDSMKVQTFERSPDDWGASQNSLGLALEKLGMRTHGDAGTSYLQQAINAFAAAEKASTPDNDLDGWLTSQTALARTDAELGDRENGTDHLEQAAEAYRDELKYLSPDRSPSAWKDANDHLNSVMDELHMRQAAAG
jgi:hypothetical protein